MAASGAQAPEKLRAAFALQPEYLKTGITEAIDFMDYGLALGRRFRALKLWFTMRYFGRDGISAILRQSRKMAAWLADQISQDDRFELAAPINMGLVCSRLRQGDEATRNLLDAINTTREFYLSHTVLNKKFTIRAAIGNMRTTWQDIEALWSRISH